MNELVSDDVIQNVLQPTYSSLVFLDASEFIHHFLVVLQAETRTLQIAQNIRKDLVCIIIISCKTVSADM